MEPSPELTAAREAWREAMRSHESFSAAHLRELEAHVDDAMEDLTVRGLSAEEAFLIATRRLGAPEPLAAEFRKAGGEPPWAGRARWMLLGMMAYLAAAAIGQVLLVLGFWIPMVLPNGWLEQVYPVLSYVVAAVAGVMVLRGFRRGQRYGFPGGAKGKSPVRLIGLTVAWIFVLPFILTCLVINFRGRFLESERLAHIPHYPYDLVHFATVAVFFCVLLVLGWRYWRPNPRLAVTE